MQRSAGGSAERQADVRQSLSDNFRSTLEHAPSCTAHTRGHDTASHNDAEGLPGAYHNRTMACCGTAVAARRCLWTASLRSPAVRGLLLCGGAVDPELVQHLLVQLRVKRHELRVHRGQVRVDAVEAVVGRPESHARAQHVSTIAGCRHAHRAAVAVALAACTAGGMAGRQRRDAPVVLIIDILHVCGLRRVEVGGERLYAWRIRVVASECTRTTKVDTR